MSKAKKPISKEKMSLAQIKETQIKKNILESEKLLLQAKIEFFIENENLFLESQKELVENEKLFLQSQVNIIDHKLREEEQAEQQL